ncbi:MAG TPA: methyltransferase [Bacteroidales bacterium]|nr:MAG: methyltransferase [Bacteroidetes bacterium GWF2_33_38]OFY89070.1 MAG: methyltransferase [Bacteroidetes bacterium RIFOXYA2_FULL_33_7]HBF87970.1 methyltransferase [Bacteroidales bacterium]
MNKELCPLCGGKSSEYFKGKTKSYFLCSNCKGIFVEKKYLPDRNTELSRYNLHNNNIADVGYQNFVSPIVNEILANHNSKEIGLDFGAGNSSVISKTLQDKGFTIRQYDPFFHNFPELLQQQYDYIVCCEVIEHFHNPAQEFALLNKLLRKNGKLYCMTNIYNEAIDFSKWWYKNDLTHVFFYQVETLNYIRENFNFSNLYIQGNLIVLSA